MRKNRLIQEKVHDPYYENKKYPDGVVCPSCQAVYKDGRWVWVAQLKGNIQNIDENLCPACRRIRDKYPAGIVTLSGSYLADHKEEILNLVNNIIEEESERSPLKKLIDMEQRKEAIIIRLTDDHLARRLGEAVGRAHKGELNIKYLQKDKFLNIFWHRDS
jgi:hypothetical protein